MRLFKLLCGGMGVCLLTAGTIWAFAEPASEPIHAALLPACGAGKCATAACSTPACSATKSECPTGGCPLGADTYDGDAWELKNVDLRNYDMVTVAHTEKLENACAAGSSCQSSSCEAACCKKAVSAENCSKSRKCCDQKTVPVTVIDAACAKGACCSESNDSCRKERCDRKSVSTKSCEHCDKNCDKGSCQHCQHETLSALAGKLFIGAGVSSNTGEECRGHQCADDKSCLDGTCVNATVTMILPDKKQSTGENSAHLHVTITVAHNAGKTCPTSGGCAAACPTTHEPVVALLPEHADYLFDPRDGTPYIFSESFWQGIAKRRAKTHPAACPPGVCPRAHRGNSFPPALSNALSAGPAYPGPGAFCPLCRMSHSPTLGRPPVVAYVPLVVGSPRPAPMAPMFNVGFPRPMAPPVAAPPVPVAPPYPVAMPNAGRPQVSAHPLSMLGPRVAYLPHNRVSAPPAPIQTVSFDGNYLVPETPPSHHPGPHHRSSDPAILGSWVRETSGSTINITCERSRVQGSAKLTIDETEMTIQFSGTCSITPDGQLFGVIDHLRIESSDSDVKSLELGMIATQMIDQPFAIHFRGNDEALFVKDVKCAGTGWFNEPGALSILNVFGCGKYVPDSQ